jgi:hypothetical protein
MTLISYVKTTTNKRLLISESHGDSNRCTPYRGKPDQHDTYASHTSPHMSGICVTPGFKAKPDAHRMYAQDQVVIHTVRM